MDEPFLGSEALRAGRLTPHALRSRFTAIHQDVYVSTGTELTPILRAKAGWLRTRRRGVVAGFSASALHGSKWIDARRPATVIDTNRRPVPGMQVWEELVESDEICLVDGMRVTTPARTALDLARRYRLDEAVTAIDALGQATRLKVADIELLSERYRGRHGIRQARVTLGLVDMGSESPRETWLRLLLIRAGFPPPQTQIPVYDEYGQLVAVVDMGWEDIKVGADYEGAFHRTPQRYQDDLRRAEALTDLGWIDVRVCSQDTEGGIIGRVGRARERRL